ncbi:MULTISPECIES: chaplin [Streptomyces]|uniref:Chaplin n=1 Tax=Streptomyces thermoviolaceus subsp. thermoviolaceus TaxID=66860 RepID=A0ABX0YX91_STRTL|nr:MULTISPECIES: chaplin [Streptomyces]MCM3266134.1 chaplin [Streptomyces thermoviolaceus]NJP16713.1 chaplin [Streptomyces thermoviolaceus subsp. thermoviolaceus]RSS01297.1 chaplin [Streptomyces sp. WAC00469]GGV80578.1 hypothetical protein GCM10010499_43780 [Streptomyces thermoviolaceus subsp. apingens]GHB10072.1 hypothetical protein GCM10010512_46920 [Streptomyces thermoviolaceus subsp. thermoviolaceus]
MRQTLSRGVFAAAAATSVLSLYGSQAFADSQADGEATNSAGLLSGNTIQAPIEVPVNVCGNTVDVAGALNPAFGNKCANVADKPTPTPTTPQPKTPPSEPSETPREETPQEPPQLAQTGSDDTAALLATSAAGAALVAGGTILYRRGRAAGAHR